MAQRIPQVDETVVEMAARHEIRIPPEKLKDPAVANKIRMVCELLSIPKNARGRDAMIGEIAENHGFARRTAYRLMKRAEQGKPIIKNRKKHGYTFKDLNITVRAWEPEAARLAIEAIMGNRRGRIEKLSLYNKVCLEAERLGLEVGSYGSFLRMARNINPTLATYRDKGVRGLREDIVPAIRRDHTAYRPMECLVGDQHKADYYCFDRNGNVVTLELFCWLDFRTQLVWHAIAYKHYNKYTVGKALINAVSWGLPTMIYTDWGKPEESNYTNLLVDQLTGLGIKCESIRRVHAKVRHPQAKPIEAWFGWLDRNLRNDGIPGYCKRLRDDRENELQRAELKEQIRSGALLHMDELVERVNNVIRGWNKHKFKNRGSDTGRSPLEIYNEETQKHPVSALSQDVLEYIFLPFQTTSVKRSQVKIRHEYIKKTISYYDPELSNHGGAEVQVRYNPFDVSCVWIFKDSRFLCQADEWGMINPKNTDQVMDRIEQQNHLIKGITEKYRDYVPPKAAIPRISPHEREARALKRSRKEKEILRVTRTPFDDDERLIAAQGSIVDIQTGEIIGDRQETGYRPLFFAKKEEPARQHLRPFNLTMGNRPIDEED